MDWDIISFFGLGVNVIVSRMFLIGLNVFTDMSEAFTFQVWLPVARSLMFLLKCASCGLVEVWANSEADRRSRLAFYTRTRSWGARHSSGPQKLCDAVHDILLSFHAIYGIFVTMLVKDSFS